MTPAEVRSELSMKYLERLPYPPYPVQEDALLAWFAAEQGVMVCAPTGTGKTMIAQAALFEALHTNTVAYYTTPLIALTEQKFSEMQAVAVKWGFKADDVGLVTGNRRVNPTARVLVVVAEILLNRLLHPEGFDFSQVSAVVMDEFHSFADPERGIVWELSLNMLPKHVRLLLLSATVGNSVEFINWLDRVHGRKIDLVEGRERKVPLTYRWVPDQYLNELLVDMAKGSDAERKTPALVFAFNRDECWSVAEQLKGLDLMTPVQKSTLNKECDKLEWPHGVGPKLKQMLRRGVGVHHAGLLPKYRRVVEDLFEKKLLSVALCPETLASGINLPARSVVVTSLVKGPFGKEKPIDPSTAHQIFGRAGRPQFDTEGFIFAYPHEDDVRISRWKQQYEQIPENTKDPVLLKKRKDLQRKKPSRNSQKKYWNESDFERLKNAAPARLYSKGPLPWRLLAYLLKVSPDVEKIRSVVRKRLLDQPRVEAGMKQLNRMLVSLHEKGYIKLEPEPPADDPASAGREPPVPTSAQPSVIDLTGGSRPALAAAPPARPEYAPATAAPTPALDKLLVFRACHPLYGAFLTDLMGVADRDERIQLLESVLELPKPLLKYVRVPFDLSAGPLQTKRLDAELIAKGLIKAETPKGEGEEEEEEEFIPWDERPPVLAEKARMLFDATYPEVSDFNTQAVWAAGDVLRYGNFNTYVTSKDLTKQEGLIFRHLLRLILLTEEFEQLAPAGIEPETWKAELKEIADKLTDICRTVDPTSTEEAIKKAHAADVVEGEEHAKAATAVAAPKRLRLRPSRRKRMRSARASSTDRRHSPGGSLLTSGGSWVLGVSSHVMQPSQPSLPRVLGPWIATAIVVGTVIGSGVFRKARNVAENVPEFGLAMGVWVLVGLLALLGALAIAEVAVLFPRAGGNYIFLREAYGRMFGFLWGWVEFWIIRSASIAALATMFTDSFHDVLKQSLHPDEMRQLMPGEAPEVLAFWPRQFLTALVIAGLAAVNARGTRIGGGLQLVITIVKIASLLFVIVLPFCVLAAVSQPQYPPRVEHLSPVWPSDWTAVKWGLFGSAMVAVIWAYHGWMNIGMMAGEVKNPQRNIPLSLVVGIGLLIALYCGANAAYYLVMPRADIVGVSSDTTVATVFCDRLLGPIGVLIASAIVMTSVFGALNGNLLVGPRLLYAMGKDGLAPRKLQELHPRYETPALATFVLAAWSCILVLGLGALLQSDLPLFDTGKSDVAGKPIKKSPFDVVTDFAMFGATTFETLAVASIFVFRWKIPATEENRPYRCPCYPILPVIYVVILSAVVSNMFYSKEQRSEALIGLGFIGVGAVVYLALFRGRGT